MDIETFKQVEKNLVKFIEIVVEKEAKGVATPDELLALSDIARTLMSC